MIDFIALVFFIVMPSRILVAVRREAGILQEFGRTNSLAYLALLFPLGPIILWSGPFWTALPIAYCLAAACFVPALIAARRCTRALEVAGTDRVQPAQAAVWQTTGTALLGLAYVGLTCAVVFFVRAM